MKALTSHKHILIAAASLALGSSVHAQFMTLINDFNNPANKGTGDIDFGTRFLAAGGGAATVFNDNGVNNTGANGQYGRLVDPGNPIANGANFSQTAGWVGGVPINSTVGALSPGVLTHFEARQASPDGTPNNFGAGRMSVFANNNGIWLGNNWSLSDPKNTVGQVRGTDASVIEMETTGSWTANQGLNGLSFGLGAGFAVNLKAAGNYVALSLTGAYRVNGGAWSFFNPIVFAADGAGGQPDFLSADFSKPGQAWLKDGLAGNDLTAPYTTWGLTTKVIGQGGNPAINVGNRVDFKAYFTAVVDPDADTDFAEIPSSEAPAYDFGSQFQPVPEPSEYAAVAALGLIGFGAWRKLKRNPAANA
jgi:hypothetical protein